ncbi:uncharacterized protein LOC108160433 [Drosophila miranda]|uniref:uncharacterized protein LOC108160433 n=1 Tax=Drosophila miranda TaxID=7229 RepID=UPI0007E873E4|nr:uncharacterized protein LOC108160433 [Drosophila miranda]
MTCSSSLLVLLSMMVLMTALPFEAHAQIVRNGHCRPTPVRVPAGGMICERQCYTPGGPPFLCRRIPLTTDLRICSGTCCRSGPYCLQLLRT